MKRTVDIQKTTMEIEEKGVKLRLTVVDTPGFGDGLEGNGSWKACVKYVDDQFASYFEVRMIPKAIMNPRKIIEQW